MGQRRWAGRPVPTRVVLLCVLVSAVAASTLAALVALFPCPDLAAVRANHRGSVVTVFDRHSVAISEFRTDFSKARTRWYPLSDFSPDLVSAVIAAEDRRFYYHFGVDPVSSLRVAYGLVSGGHRMGASTIPMQLVTMLDGSAGRRRSVWTKLRQMILATSLSLQFSKDEILEGYLNLVPVRGEMVGVPAAALGMFGKYPSGLSAPEAAVIAALLRGPNADRERLLRRARAVVGKGLVTNDAELTGAVSQGSKKGSQAIHRLQLADAAGRLAWRLSGKPAEVKTTLDEGIQRKLTEIVAAKVDPLRGRNVSDAAVLVVKNDTGEVLGYIGGSGALSSARYVDGVQAMRSAGSTLKPFLYGVAIADRILTADSRLDDSPANLSVGASVYRPENYDREFRGWVSVRESLASSLNIPAVRALELVGVAKFSQHLRALGFNFPGDDERYGYALALGAAPVSLWQLTNAYRTIANEGMSSPLRLTGAQSGTANGSIRLYSSEVAFVLSSILSDRVARSATFGLENPLATAYWSAAKTGTSRDMRDNWAVGFSRDFTVGVWVGNFSGQAMWNVTGITGAAPIWTAVMNFLHERFGQESDREARWGTRLPSGITQARGELYLSGTEPMARLEGLSVETASESVRIVYPPNGIALAIDPEIPRERQRLQIKLSHAGTQRVVVRVDGKELHREPDGGYNWGIATGGHTVEVLTEPGGRIIDTARFTVR